MWLRIALSTSLLVASTGLSSAVADTPLQLDLPPTSSVEDAHLDHHVQQARALLDALNLDGRITSRRKSPYSTWMKMHRKGLTLDKVLDRLAMRVCVDTSADCYEMFDALTARHAVVPGSVHDYIVTPKDNGYASLHLVLDLQDGPIEVQLRTHGMHHDAESGAASHAEYKRGQGFVLSEAAA